MPYTSLSPVDAAAVPHHELGAPRIDYGRSLQKMRDTLFLRLGRRADVYNPDVGDYSMLDDFINSAYLDLASMTEFSEQRESLRFETAIGRATYILPDNILAVQSVVLFNLSHPAGGTNLVPIHEEAYRILAARTGAPLEYFEFDSATTKMLVLYPTPDRMYQIQVVARIVPQPLKEEDDCPYLDIQFHEGIELLARVKAHSALSEAEDTTLANNEFVAFMRRRQSKAEIRDENRRPGSSVPKNKYQLRHRRLRSPEDY